MYHLAMYSRSLRCRHIIKMQPCSIVPCGGGQMYEAVGSMERVKGSLVGPG